MSKSKVVLVPLHADDREQFIKDNQWAFKYGAMEEFGLRNDQMKEEGEIISRKTIEGGIDRGEAYRIVCDDKISGGVVIHVEKDRGFLDLLFTLPDVHSKGIGYGAWCEVEKLHPEVEVWETFTPYFETRNIHFYVNKCGFHIVEFFNPFHKGPYEHMDSDEEDCGGTGMDFRFEKVVRK